MTRLKWLEHEIAKLEVLHFFPLGRPIQSLNAPHVPPGFQGLVHSNINTNANKQAHHLCLVCIFIVFVHDLRCHQTNTVKEKENLLIEPTTLKNTTFFKKNQQNVEQNQTALVTCEQFSLDPLFAEEIVPIKTVDSLLIEAKWPYKHCYLI